MAYRNWVEEESVARGIEYGVWADLKAVTGHNMREFGTLVWTIVRDWRAIAIILLAGTLMIGAPSANAFTGGEGVYDGRGHTLPTLPINIDQPTSFNALPNHSVSEQVITQGQVNAERIERIQMAAIQMNANPEAWVGVPETCAKSMVKVAIYGPGNESNGGSGSLISSQHLVDEYRNPFMLHTILVSDHVMRGQNGDLIVDGGRVVLYPGSYNDDQKYAFNVIGYQQVVGDDGTMLDEGILTVYGQGSWGDMSSEGAVPLGVNNVRGFDAVNLSGTLWSFDYPGILGSNIPQFTVSTTTGTFTDSHGDVTQLVEPLPNSSTVWPQSSGGAMCSLNGEHRGVVKNIPPMEATTFGIEENPMSIQSQIISAMYDAQNELELMFGPLSQ